jgi:hypothetical protein
MYVTFHLNLDNTSNLFTLTLISLQMNLVSCKVLQPYKSFTKHYLFSKTKLFH